MANIAMCANESCPLKLSCYRYMAKPDQEWQSYARFEWKKDENGVIHCPAFWKLNTEQHDTKTKRSSKESTDED